MWLVFSDRFDHQNSVYECFFKLLVLFSTIFDEKELILSFKNIMRKYLRLPNYFNSWEKHFFFLNWNVGLKTYITKEDWNVVKIIWSACHDNEVGVVFWYL